MTNVTTIHGYTRARPRRADITCDVVFTKRGKNSKGEPINRTKRFNRDACNPCSVSRVRFVPAFLPRSLLCPPGHRRDPLAWKRALRRGKTFRPAPFPSASLRFHSSRVSFSIFPSFRNIGRICEFSSSPFTFPSYRKITKQRICRKISLLGEYLLLEHVLFISQVN